MLWARTLTQVVLRILGVVWASPYTLIGLVVGGVGLCTGGGARVRGGVIEFYGGAVRWAVRHLPPGPSTQAITLGHTVLGQSQAALDHSHDHEMVHVRQFQRWGPLMGPAYLLASLGVWIAGGRPYRDNPFERQAYEESRGQ